MSGKTIDLSELEIEVESVKSKELPKTEKKDKKPPKRPKSYSASRYARLPPTKVINKFIVKNTNARILKDKERKLTIKDCEIGEATMYMVEYYTSLDPYHPVLVLMGAIMGFGMTVMELQSGPDAKSDSD